MQHHKVLRSIARHALIYALMLIVFFPFFWMMVSSFQHNVDILNASKPLFDFTPTLKNYDTVFGKYKFIEPIGNSFFVAAVSTLYSLILGLPAAYAIARYKFRAASLLILVVRMIPGITFLVPWYQLFRSLRLINTFTALILSHMLVTLPFIVWIMTPYFENVPRDLEHASWVDGSSQLGTFVRIVLPVSSPGIISASLLSFIFSWNNFMFSLVLSSGKTTTLPIAIFSFMSYASVDWGGLMAAAVVITAPIVLLSLLSQKYIVAGLTAGAVKG